MTIRQLKYSIVIGVSAATLSVGMTLGTTVQYTSLWVAVPLLNMFVMGAAALALVALWKVQSIVTPKLQEGEVVSHCRQPGLFVVEKVWPKDGVAYVSNMDRENSLPFPVAIDYLVQEPQ